MELKTTKKMEYRFTKEVQGKNGAYYLYTFESEDSSYVFYCKDFFKLEKGKLYDLQFSVIVFNSQNQFNLVNVL